MGAALEAAIRYTPAIIPMKITFRYAPEEYKRAVWLHHRQRLRPKLDVVTALLGLGLGIWLVSKNQELLGGALILLAFFLGFILIWARYILPSIVFAREPKLRDEYQLEFTDRGVSFKTSSIDSKLEWSLYTRAIFSAEHYLLYYGSQSFSVIPRRVFATDHEREDFERLVDTKLRNKIVRLGV